MAAVQRDNLTQMTVTVTEVQAVTASPEREERLVLRLQPSSGQRHGMQQKKAVTWTEDTVDNENMQKKKSKKCCVFHKQRNFDESSSDEEDDHNDHDCGHACSGTNKSEGESSGGLSP
eukprot:TRINITY_DN1792_c0_g1_i2.p1 TRINITY_DN1792_c0_g1~~TRINITY_DN1792_c0_g1_i2.p1  ORF type:complete len:132 (+),score=18.14 TRINITY_DN1792_c0_g1_i2:43-396(+)